MVLLVVAVSRGAAAQDIVARGAYLLRAAGCVSCHTVPGGVALAGGRAMSTPFGTFYTPNITPDRETGIGGWTDADFLRALREGVRPDGARYFPVFPYPSFTGISDEDGLAIKAYLFSLTPVRSVNRAHDVRFPFSWRLLQRGWRMMFFAPGPYKAGDRGGYLVTSLSHCGECHTPRNLLGAQRRSLWLSGTRDGPDGQVVPNITPDVATGIGGWDRADIAEVLRSGRTPEGSRVKGAMREAVADGLQDLTDADRDAIARYLLAQPAIVHRVDGDERGWLSRIWGWFRS